MAKITQRDRDVLPEPRWELITPQYAQELIDHSHNFRDPGLKRIEKYAEDMRFGRFDTKNGQTLLLDADGRVIDGNHRMHAIVKSGVTLPFLVVVNDTATAGTTVTDIGAARTLSQYLKRLGYDNPSTVSGIIRSAAGYYDIGLMGGHATRTLEDYIQDPNSAAAEKFGRKVHKIRVASGTNGINRVAIGAVLAVGSRWTWGDECQRFLDICTGEESDPSSPINLLQYASLRNGNTARYRVPRLAMAARTVKAWNAHVTGRKIKAINWTPARGEKFPRILDLDGQDAQDE